MMPVLGWHFASCSEGLVTHGSEDDCNIHFLCNVHCRGAGLVSHEGQLLLLFI
jgi:hypothetical protein